jgi:hypothetical protein
MYTLYDFVTFVTLHGNDKTPTKNPFLVSNTVHLGSKKLYGKFNYNYHGAHLMI